MARTEYSQSRITWWHADDPPNDERAVLVVVDPYVETGDERYIDFGQYWANGAIWKAGGEYVTGGRKILCWAEMPEVTDE